MEGVVGKRRIEVAWANGAGVGGAVAVGFVPTVVEFGTAGTLVAVNVATVVDTGTRVASGTDWLMPVEAEQLVAATNITNDINLLLIITSQIE